ncbi:MAG: hypothetical protein WAP35_03600 [Solirubrobacterales bacterium]
MNAPSTSAPPTRRDQLAYAVLGGAGWAAGGRAAGGWAAGGLGDSEGVTGGGGVNVDEDSMLGAFEISVGASSDALVEVGGATACVAVDESDRRAAPQDPQNFPAGVSARVPQDGQNAVIRLWSMPQRVFDCSSRICCNSLV